MITDKVSENVAFICHDGTKIQSIQQLLDKLQTMPQGEYNSHVNDETNNFANWIEGVFGEKRVADHLRNHTERDAIKAILKYAIAPKKISKPASKSVPKTQPTTQEKPAKKTQQITHNHTVSTSSEPTLRSLSEEIEHKIKHMERELDHLVQYHKTEENKHYAQPDDFKERLVDFLFGLAVGIILGVIIAKSVTLF